jgi:hypothetical protein
MGKTLQTVGALVANAIVAGFFGLACAFINLLWLEYAIKHFPKVSYTMDYQTQFGIISAAGYFLLALFRMVQSRLNTIFPRGIEIVILSIFLAIGMIGFTPVPDSHFIRYMIDQSTVQNQGPTLDVPKGPENK